MKDTMKDIMEDFQKIMDNGDSGIFFLTNNKQLKERYEKLLGSSSSIELDEDFLNAFTNCVMVYYQKKNDNSSLN